MFDLLPVFAPIRVPDSARDGRAERTGRARHTVRALFDRRPSENTRVRDLLISRRTARRNSPRA